MLRLQIDDDIFWRQRRGGISRYFVELIRQFGSHPEFGVVVDQPRLWTRNEHLIDSGLGRRMPTRIGRKPEAQLLANRVQHRWGKPPDVLHHTFYSNAYLAQHPTPRIRAVTVYDMIPEAMPEWFEAGNPHLDKREMVAAADVILCISESTKRDLERFYGPQQAPIVVTPLAVGTEFAPSAPRLEHLPDTYVLYVGERGRYKDFPTLVEAFAALAPAVADLRLVVVGGGDFTASEHELFESKSVADRIRHFRLRDEELPSAYVHAVCYVSTSRYEGFGLPTLEALACGCPALLARSSSLPEVAGDAAHYFEPGDHEQLRALIETISGDADQRKALQALGLARAATFSWRRTAELTAGAYRVTAPQAALPGR